jgi:hypothetical protein
MPLAFFREVVTAARRSRERATWTFLGTPANARGGRRCASSARTKGWWRRQVEDVGGAPAARSCGGTGRHTVKERNPEAKRGGRRSRRCATIP